MAIHIRQVIRTGVVGILNGVTALPTVETNRTTALSQSELPAVVVTSGNESIEANQQIGGGAQGRVYTLLITVAVNDTLPVEDTLDSLILEVEKAIYSWDYRTVSNDILVVSLTDIEQVLSDSSSEFIGTATLSYNISYRVVDNDPEL